MATTIGIADKSTLDAIKSKVDLNLDKKISEISGGTNWAEKSFVTSCIPYSSFTVGSMTYSYTHLSITGSGWLVGLFCGNVSGFMIQIDNGDVYKIFSKADRQIGSLNLIRFNNKLVVKSFESIENEMGTHCWVVLD